MAQASKRQLDEQQEIVNVVKALTGVTVIRLAQTQEVLGTTRNLLDRINQSISRVFEIYPAKGKNVFNKRKQLVQKNRPYLIKEPLLIYLSANQEHYGDLIEKIGQNFIHDIQNTKSDGLVIGKIGRIFVEGANLKNTIHYFDLDDDKPEVANINQIIKTIESYEKVIIYHGENESLLHQVPVKHEIYNIAPRRN